MTLADWRHKNEAQQAWLTAGALGGRFGLAVAIEECPRENVVISFIYAGPPFRYKAYFGKPIVAMVDSLTQSAGN